MYTQQPLKYSWLFTLGGYCRLETPFRRIPDSEAEYRYRNVFKLNRAVILAFWYEDERALRNVVCFIFEGYGHITANGAGILSS